MRKYYRPICLLFILLCLLSNVKGQNLENISKQKPFTVAGSLDVRGMFYNASGISPRRESFSYLLNGSPVFSVYGINIPVSFTYSKSQKDFHQPFNQFGLSPVYKWITVHGGYRNVQFSPYTLAGYTMLGGGVELNPGKFRFGFMYGRLNKATSLDTTTGLIEPYSFSRKGWASKIGYGTDERFIELSFLSARDDSNSVKAGIPDSMKTVTPAANAVASIAMKYQLIDKIYFEADAGFSVYTYNSNSQIGKSEELEKINKSFKSVVPVNASSQANLAYHAGLTYKATNYSLNLSYRYVDPEFQSMGAYFITNDFRNITFSPTLNLAKGMLRVNGSIGLQSDNLREQKEQTTTRVIGSGNVSWDITDQIGLDMNYVNYSTKATPQVILVNNKYLLAQTSQDISATPRYVISNQKFSHVVIGSFNYSTLTDQNPDTKAFNEIKNTVALLTYNLTFLSTGLALNACINNTRSEYYNGEVTSNGFSLGANKNFLKNKLSLSATGSVTFMKQQQKSTIINGVLSGGYNVSTHHRFYTRWNILNNQSGIAIPGASYTENMSELGYTWTF